MKKTLLTLGVLGLMTFGLTSCGDEKDCDCTVAFGDTTQALYTEDAPSVTDFDGDCEDVEFSDMNIAAEDLPEGVTLDSWSNYAELGGTFTCVED